MSSDLKYPLDTAAPAPRIREQDIEDIFISKLRDLKYSYRDNIRNRADLEANFREKFEALNRVRLTDAEFARLLDDLVSPDVFKTSIRLREKNDFTRDDGTPLSYTLVNIRDWCKNDYEVVTQLRINTDYSHHRYDVLLLINGVPVAQVELKTLGVSPRRAMEQIVDYKTDPGNGYTRTLLCFIQLFIVSNRTETFYFSNNNPRHFSFAADEQFLPVYKFADKDNTPITHLGLFADRFLQKCELGRMISRYMVLIQSEQKLLIMRPYQVYAVQAIVDSIEQRSGDGYIWHTTGSGKTLTSFKASTLLRDNPAIDKCLFVVDRKDLDKQTRDEFNRFQEGCVEANTNTATLVRRLLSDEKSDKVIVTTIQKLGLALDENSRRNRQREKRGRETYTQLLEPLRDKRVVLIFDECHRSQFGDIGKIYGQEKNITTYNLARMNMLLHGVKDTEFEIYHGDTLFNDWDILRETNPAKMPKFDAVVANPPFSLRWEPKDDMSEDVRFKNHGIAPKSAADFAFLLHGLHYLKEQGVMAIILPHGVLFRGGAEEKIRTKLLKDGHIDTVIGLPANLFYSTGIPVCILVLKRCKKPDDVLFINAAEHFEKGKRQNFLADEHIDKIVETYRDRREEDRYSRRVSMERIAEEEYNLNISRYISTSKAEEEINLSETHEKLVSIEEDIRKATLKHNGFLKELGLAPIPFGETPGK